MRCVSLSFFLVGESDHARIVHRPRSLRRFDLARGFRRSEEHTSELQSQSNLVCRLLLEKKKYRLLSVMVYDKRLVDDSPDDKFSDRDYRSRDSLPCCADYIQADQLLAAKPDAWPSKPIV